MKLSVIALVLALSMNSFAEEKKTILNMTDQEWDQVAATFDDTAWNTLADKIIDLNCLGGPALGYTNSFMTIQYRFSKLKKGYCDITTVGRPGHDWSIYRDAQARCGFSLKGIEYYSKHNIVTPSHTEDTLALVLDYISASPKISGFIEVIVQGHHRVSGLSCWK